MCDTLAIKRPDGIWLAKNSDREAAEPQLVERHAAVCGDSESRLACTHIEIEQVPDRHAVIISRPSWMWGAEMGVNEHGVAIGNEAIFSNRVMKKGKALLGMDLLRLGLERGATAQEAAGVIIRLLEQYGQGGPAGYRNKSFRYDNSFLIADPSQALVLETCGRDWVIKMVRDHWSISNTYTVGSDIAMKSEQAPSNGFAEGCETWLLPRFGHAGERLACSRAALDALRGEAVSFEAIAAILRTHDRGDGFSRGSNRDLCMHAGGPFRPSHSTASMMVKLVPGEAPRLLMTGSKTPCISLFRPVAFEGGFSVLDPQVWPRSAERHEAMARDREARETLQARLAVAEGRIFPLVEAGEAGTAEAFVQAWDEHDLAVTDAD